jgi:putative acetyltransferase
MYIRKTEESDIEVIMDIENKAFGGREEAELVEDLLDDPSAEPYLSLLAFIDNKPVGHILFTRAEIENDGRATAASILAPLAVVPGHQNKGIGGKLIVDGLRLLRDAGTGFVFVLGHPGYYPRHGFIQAGRYGLEATYPVPEEVSDAWMVQQLKRGLLGRIKGRVLCADAMNRPDYWRE